MTIHADFGPIPVSRLKAERKSLFAALERGRRVLISRHGRVVAAIEPASVERHARGLAAFAAGSEDSPQVLAASDFSQGSVSEFVRQAADEGIDSLVTRDNRVFGVLTQPVVEASDADIELREDLVRTYEHLHPGATPGELADVAAKVTFGGPSHTPTAQSTAEDAHRGEALDRRLLAEVLWIHSHAQERARGSASAAAALNLLIDEFSGDTDQAVSRKVMESKAELARLYLQAGRLEAALELTRDVIDDLGSGDALRNEEAAVASVKA